MKYEEIIQRLENLRETPPVDVSNSVIEPAIQEFYKRYPKSLAMFEEMKKYIPGGIEHMNSIQYPFPIVINKAQGPYLFDLNGNKFIDYLMTSGPCILGHNYPEVRDYVIEVLRENGPATGVMCEYELLAAKKICEHMENVSKVRFYQSGSEANMAMARIARLYTDKKKIIKVEGSYHGWADQFVTGLHLPGTGPMFAHGIPPEHYSNTVGVMPNDIEGIKKAISDNKDKGGTAAIVLEACGGDSGTFPPAPGYLEEVREICTENDVLLVFDEVVTGFRLSMGGAQEYYGIDADISVLGKIVGHEYPSAGAVGARDDIMQMILGKGGNNSEIGQKVFTAGTMAGTNLTSAAAYKAIECIEKTNTIEIAGKVADELSKGLNKIFADYKLPFFTYNFKSIIQLRMSGFYTVDLTKPNAIKEVLQRRENAAKYQILEALEGINTLQSIRMYTSLMHNDNKLINDTLVGFERICQKLSK
ncbi:MAG: aminotransferase class III-fold pyridoxal phosphate-dependent enzyme [Candidatus Lokiarchaeota archaeon]|nr:aminotransferase class III-fold pyridoxal phosphate-dependent enzyme [Candidatus Lokiarchaeota archaeon]